MNGPEAGWVIDAAAAKGRFLSRNEGLQVESDLIVFRYQEKQGSYLNRPAAEGGNFLVKSIPEFGNILY